MNDEQLTESKLYDIEECLKKTKIVRAHDEFVPALLGKVHRLRNALKDIMERGCRDEDCESSNRAEAYLMGKEYLR